MVDVSGNIGSQFKDYLQNSNGTGMDWYSSRGCHLLVHGDQCTDTLAGAEGDSCEYSGGGGFGRGVVSWTGTGSSDGLVQNSAVQETLHQFIQFEYSGVKDMLGDGSDGGTSIDPIEEHTLGKVWDGSTTNDISPMLTYHFSNQQKTGTCQSSLSFYDGYDHTITSCTIDAVDITSRGSCNDQHDIPCP